MSDRRKQILTTAISLIADQGYGSLSMRALARASQMKLGALQYHFPTWNDLLTSLAIHISGLYRDSLAELKGRGEAADILELVDLLMEDEVGKSLGSERLLPQLWAMGMVEPVMGELLQEIYSEYLETLEASLRQAGNSTPRAEALMLMTLIEGSTLFLSGESPWASYNKSVRENLLRSLKEKHGNSQ